MALHFSAEVSSYYWQCLLCAAVFHQFFASTTWSANEQYRSFIDCRSTYVHGWYVWIVRSLLSAWLHRMAWILRHFEHTNRGCIVCGCIDITHCLRM